MPARRHAVTKRRQPSKAVMTRTMKAIARKRACISCGKQNALSKVAVGTDGLLWRTCHYCAKKVWAGE
jgi:hypothetical protein